MMERALKERIVGAVVLVVIVVLVVPVFLDGSAGNVDVVSESVVLPGQNSQPRKQQTIVLERDRSEPVPVPNAATSRTDVQSAEQGPAAKAPAKQAAVADAGTDHDAGMADRSPVADQTRPAVEAPAADREDARPAAPAPQTPADDKPVTAGKDEPQSTTGMWAVQLGSFSSLDNAERLSADLRAKGYAAFLSQLKNGAKPLHRVRIGPQKDRDSAEKIAARLAADGYKGQVVPHP